MCSFVLGATGFTSGCGGMGDAREDGGSNLLPSGDFEGEIKPFFFMSWRENLPCATGRVSEAAAHSGRRGVRLNQCSLHLGTDEAAMSAGLVSILLQGHRYEFSLYARVDVSANDGDVNYPTITFINRSEDVITSEWRRLHTIVGPMDSDYEPYLDIIAWSDEPATTLEVDDVRMIQLD